jgi:uncharacterized membrane protein
MKYSMKFMWGCVAVFGAVVILAVAGVSGAYAIPCLLMMGVMMWMMMGGMRRGSQHGHSDSAAETAPQAKAPVVRDLDERLVRRGSPAEILERRFAEGAISVEEYRARREALVNGATAPNGAGKEEPLTALRGEGRQ